MKKHTSIKRFFALALALVMVFSLAFTALAAEAKQENAYQITIKGNNNTDYSMEARFHAYQIFAGTINEEEGGYNGGTAPNNPPKANQLSNVTWGTGIKQDTKPTDIQALLTELMGSGKTLAELGISNEAIEKMAGKDAYKDLFSGVAAVLAKDKGDGTYDDGLIEETYKAALATAIEGVMGTKLGEVFKAALKAAKYITDDAQTFANGDDIDWTKSAQPIASAISDLNGTVGTNNSALARAFAAIVAKKDSGNYKYLSTTHYDSTWANNGSSTAEADKKDGWRIGDSSKDFTDAATTPLAGGYYLIVDMATSTNADESMSDYMVAVFGSQTIQVKSNVPTVDKVIKNSNGTYSLDGPSVPEGGNFEIGEEIVYRLTGTLPENYDAYSEYYYWFSDTMDSGLTYTGAGSATSPVGYTHVYITVEAPNPKFTSKEATSDWEKAETLTLTIDVSALISTDTFTYGDAVDTNHIYVNYSNQILKVYFKDMKKLPLSSATLNPTIADQIKAQVNAALKALNYTGDEVDTTSVPAEKLKITADSKVYVDYTAQLNENAMVNTTYGGSNSVELNYSNDATFVRSESDKGTAAPDTGKTTAATAYAATFGMEFEKVNQDGKPLAGAAFALQKTYAEDMYVLESPDGTKQVTVKKSELGDENFNADVNSTIPDTAKAYQGYKVVSKQEKGTYYAVLKRGTELYVIYDDSGTDTVYATISATELAKYGIQTGSIVKDAKLSVIGTNGTGKQYSDYKFLFAGTEGQETAQTTYEYSIAAWVTADTVKDYTSEKWGTKLTGSVGGFTVDSGDYFLAITTTAGGAVRIVGMDTDVTYVLEEVITPSGYDTIENISVKFSAAYYSKDLGHTDGTLKTLIAEVTMGGEKTKLEIVTDGAWGKDATTWQELVAHFNVTNYSSGYLPGTGGSGVYMFYVVGGALMLGAVLFLILSNVKKKPEKRAEQ